MTILTDSASFFPPSENKPARSWHEERRLIDRLNLPGIPKAVLHEIHGCLRKNHKEWPSLSTIAERVGFSRRSVIRGIRLLEELGILKKDQRWDSVKCCWLSNLYTIRWDIVSQRVGIEDPETG